MSFLSDIVINLLVALVSILVGRFWRYLTDKIKLKSAYQFWGPLTKRQFNVIVPRYFGYAKFKQEQIGLIGGGTTSGLIELSSYLRTLGVENLSLHYADTVNGDDLKTNLIVLGGPRSHPLMKDILQKIPSSWEFVKESSGENVILDTKRSETIRSTIQEDEQNGLQEVAKDYAIVYSVGNPFAEKSRILLIAGLHDYGTWGGMRFVTSPVFFHHPLIRNSKSFVVLIEVDVLRKFPQKFRIIEARKLNHVEKY